MMSEPQSTAEKNMAETGPLVSVIMPSYNSSHYIEQAIESVLTQDYPNLELIVIDDGSTDNTSALVQGYGNAVTLFRQKNLGSASARNLGLKAARGRYVAFLDSDDIWLPGKLRLQVSYLETHPEIDMIYSRWHVWKPGTNGSFELPTHLPSGQTAEPAALSIVPEGSGWLYNRLLFTSLLHTITVMARRSLLERVGPFNPELKRGQDYDYWIRSSRLTEIHQLDQVLALYRVHGQGCVTRWPDVNYERLVVETAVSRWGLCGPNGEQTKREALKHRIAKTCFDFGYHHYWSGSPEKALAAFKENVRLRPSHLSAWRYLILSAMASLRQPNQERNGQRTGM